MNRFGFRGLDWLEQPAPDTFRIAVIGDSFVDSANLPDERALTSVIEKHLAACPAFPNGRVEVLNLGVSGYGTAQEYLLLQQRVASFHPNLVMLAFYVGNDVANNSRAISMSNDGKAAGVDDKRPKPYFIEQPQGELQLDMSFRDANDFQQTVQSDWQKQLVNRSYLLQVLKQIYLGLPIATSPAEPRYAVAGIDPALFEPEFSRMFSPPSDDDWRSAWSVTEKLLLRMRDWTQQKRVDFALVVIPAPVQALPGEEMRQAGIRAFGLSDLDYSVRRIVLFAARHGISYVNLLDSFRAFGDRERVFLFGFPPKLGHGHLNAIGSQVAGRSIADWLCHRRQSEAKDL
jgi:lysophospholipase L1-like esterase